MGNAILRQEWTGGATSTVRLGLDGWDPAKTGADGTANFDVWARLDGSNSLVSRFAFGPGIDQVVTRQSAAGAVSWYMADFQGSIRRVIDNSGAMLAAATYSAYGQILTGSLYGPYGYTGREADSLIGGGEDAWNLRARLYLAKPGVFTSEDPLGIAPDVNRHRYVHNSPTNGTDPSGLELIVVGDDTKAEMLKWFADRGVVGKYAPVPFLLPEGAGDMWEPHAGKSIYLFGYPPTMAEARETVSARFWERTRNDPFGQKVNSAWGNPHQHRVVAKEGGALGPGKLAPNGGTWPGTFNGKGLYIGTPTGENVLNRDQRLHAFGELVGLRGLNSAKQAIGYQDFTHQSWVDAGLEAVITKMLIDHPNDGPALVAWALRVNLKVDAEQLTVDATFNGHEYKGGDPPRLQIDSRTALGTPRTVKEASEYLYAGLSENSEKSWISRCLDGAGRAFMAHWTNGADDETRLWLEEQFRVTDAQARLGVNVALNNSRQSILQNSVVIFGISAGAAATKLAGKGVRVATGAAPQGIGGIWKFSPKVDLDWRRRPGRVFENYRAALDEAFRRTGVPRSEFVVTKTAKSIDGKTLPVQWEVKSGPKRGAQVNVDDPRIVPTSNGPADPHVGYQTPGKRGDGGAVRGHIILDYVPVTRGRLNE